MLPDHKDRKDLAVEMVHGLVKSIAHIIGFQMTLTQSLAPAGSMETC